MGASEPPSHRLRTGQTRAAQDIPPDRPLRHRCAKQAILSAWVSCSRCASPGTSSPSSAAGSTISQSGATTSLPRSHGVPAFSRDESALRYAGYLGNGMSVCLMAEQPCMTDGQRIGRGTVHDDAEHNSDRDHDDGVIGSGTPRLLPAPGGRRPLTPAREDRTSPPGRPWPGCGNLAASWKRPVPQ